MKCDHLKEDGYPAIKLEDSEIRCSLCGTKFGLGPEEIKSLIKLSTNLTSENILVKFTSKSKYYYCYENDLESISTHEDVYIDGSITETSLGKVFADFNFAIIIKKDNGSNEVKKIIVIVKSDKGKKDTTSHPAIIKYLSPTVLNLLF